MTKEKENFEEKIKLLKDSRLKMLQLHKILVDMERSRFERLHGAVSSGKFLNLLIENEDFAWLRKFSTLIVEIDEMFDLDDGFHEGFIDSHLKSIKALISLETEDGDFNKRFGEAIDINTKVREKKDEIESVLN